MNSSADGQPSPGGQTNHEAVVSSSNNVEGLEAGQCAETRTATEGQTTVIEAGSVAVTADGSSTASTTTTKPTKSRVLQPDEEVMKLEDIPPLQTWIYVLLYIAFVVYTISALYFTITEAENPWYFLKYAGILCE